MPESIKSARVKNHGDDSLHYPTVAMRLTYIYSTYIAIVEEQLLYNHILLRSLISRYSRQLRPIQHDSITVCAQADEDGLEMRMICLF